MAKLPEHLRPEFKTVLDALEQRVSPRFRDIFVLDIQNDCDCDIEKYDRGLMKRIVYLDYGGIKDLDKDSVEPGLPIYDWIHLPMLNDISEKDIWKLLKAASNSAPYYSANDDITPSNIIYNPKSDGNKVLALYTEVTGKDICPFRDGTIPGWFAADFVDENEVFFTPEPEFFGVISANIGKFGAFCIPDNMLRRYL